MRPLVAVLIVFVACVVVPPPQNPQRAPTAQPPATPANGASYGGTAYGGATYGINTCTAGYGGATYGGTNCKSWLATEMPGQVAANALDVAAMIDNGARCRLFSMDSCQPAIGAMIILTNAATGATMSGKADRTGHFVFGGVSPGPYRIRTEYLGIALQQTLSLDASVARFGQPIGAVFSPADFR